MMPTEMWSIFADLGFKKHSFFSQLRKEPDSLNQIARGNKGEPLSEYDGHIMTVRPHIRISIAALAEPVCSNGALTSRMLSEEDF
jgi:hypothetical protein